MTYDRGQTSSTLAVPLSSTDSNDWQLSRATKRVKAGWTKRMNPWRWFAAGAALFLVGAAIWWLSGIAWLTGLGIWIFGLLLWVMKRNETRRLAKTDDNHGS